MIIKCENCNKKFELEESLIPDSGRLLKCSNCENTWFFTKKKKILNYFTAIQKWRLIY